MTHNIHGDASKTVLSELTETIGRVFRYFACTRAEQQLEALDDRLLSDIGINRGDIHHAVWGDEDEQEGVQQTFSEKSQQKH